MWWLMVAAAMAAFPVPDRPYVSRSGALVKKNTLELELGYRYLNQSQVPATLKYSIAGAVEARVESNLSGVGSNAPDLLAGAKIKLFRKDRRSLALWAASGIPVGDEQWRGELHALFTTLLTDRSGLRVNTGIDFVGGSSVGFGGVPVNVAVTYHPIKRFGLIAEAAGAVGTPGCEDLVCVYGNVQAQGGIRGRITDLLVVDVSGGYSFEFDAPFAGVGFTSNFGRVE
ncbi:MAG: hypothetical protein AAF211_10660 [Myxococcota bacterium]